MKKFLLGSVALAAMIAGPAMAADMPLKAPPPVVTYYDWSGYYLGFSAGMGNSHYKWAYTNPVPATLAPFTTDHNEWWIDVHAGAQYQWNSIVVGVEANVSVPAGNNFGSQLGGAATGPCTAIAGQVCRTRLYEIDTVGGKLGWAWDKWLFSVKGGWASGLVVSNLINGAGALVDVTPSLRLNGWFAGGGVEYMIAKGSLVDVIAGVDYQHVDLETKFFTSSLDGFGPAPPGVNGRNISASADIVRGTLTIKWNPWPAAAVYAKY